MNSEECLFCHREDTDRHQVFAENDLAYARWDNYPVSVGHAEVVPKEHIDSFFDLNNNQLVALYSLLKTARAIIIEKHHPDGFNVGLNNDEMAGRTIPHLHLHLIPRYKGDVENPRGGIRHIIPAKGNY